MALSDETIEAIQKAVEEGEKILAEKEADIEEARRAGIDMSKEMEELQKLKEKIRLLRQVYGKYFR
jgi:DNA replicative helicase MCM subunit Mcm2 (Cdc46/Mcm family)